jgi:hypothetical protein
MEKYKQAELFIYLFIKITQLGLNESVTKPGVITVRSQVL